LGGGFVLVCLFVVLFWGGVLVGCSPDPAPPPPTPPPPPRPPHPHPPSSPPPTAPPPPPPTPLRTRPPPLPTPSTPRAHHGPPPNRPPPPAPAPHHPPPHPRPHPSACGPAPPIFSRRLCLLFCSPHLDPSSLSSFPSPLVFSLVQEAHLWAGRSDPCRLATAATWANESALVTSSDSRRCRSTVRRGGIHPADPSPVDPQPGLVCFETPAALRDTCLKAKRLPRPRAHRRESASGPPRDKAGAGESRPRR